MRRIASVIAVVVFASVAAAQIGGGGGDKPDDKPKGDVVKGEVKKVDVENYVLTLNVKGKDEKFRIPRGIKITVQVADKTENARNGLNDLWFQSADKASGSGRFFVELSKKKDEILGVHLLTPTARQDP